MTLVRNVKGFYSHNNDALRKSTVVVRFTSDNLGETLSLDCRGHMIIVKFAEVMKIVERERAKGYTDGHLIIDEGWGEDNG